jgi:large subunit ribosomal protein L32e
MEKDVAAARKRIRNKKPDFIRQEGRKVKRLGKSWRKPRGIQSKIRLGRRGKPAKVKIGYRTPLQLRGITPKGLIEINISKLSELANLNKSKHAIVISRRIGLKKKIDLVKKVSEAGFTIVNTNIKTLESKLKIKTEEAKAKKKTEKKKEEKKKEEPKKTEEKKEEKKKEEPKKTEEKKEEKKKETKKKGKKKK